MDSRWVTYTIQIGEDGNDEKRNSVEGADEDEPEDTNQSLSSEFTRSLVHVTPNLAQGMVSLIEIKRR